MGHVAMSRGRGWRAVLVISILAGPSVAAGQPVGGPTGPDAAHLDLDHGVIRPAPFLHASVRLPPRPLERLEQAFAIAAHRIRTLPACRALFEDLDLDAHTALDFSIYYPARIDHEVTTCRHAVAFSYVGGGPTRLCRRFGDLGLERAVEVVLHEALHRAGLTEHGAQPSGLVPSQIDALVHRACCPGAEARPPHAFTGRMASRETER